jgi:hypothetical protein
VWGETAHWREGGGVGETAHWRNGVLETARAGVEIRHRKGVEKHKT